MELHSSLLERAEHVLDARGVQALSLRELARAAGVSHGAPRRHLPDKQALLDALALDGFERLGRELLTAMETADHDFDGMVGADRLDRVVNAVVARLLAGLRAPAA